MTFIKKISAAICIVFIIICNSASAQKNISLHTIKEGETLSALAKKYSTTVGDIMRLNSMNSKSQLKVGEAIKIPSATSATPIMEVPKQAVIKLQTTPKKPETIVTMTDITYTVLKGQSLYGIAKQFKTSEAQLKTWNNLLDDKIKIGQVIIVGKEPIERSTIPVVQQPQTTKNVEDKPEPTKPAVQPTRDDDLTTLNAGSAKVTKPEPTPTPPVKESVKTEPTAILSNVKYIDKEGYFAGYFNRKEKSSNTTNGEASIFKSTSGWNDKKYYVMISNITQGTIVRLTANNKSICAKVLASLPDIKEDTGLLLRLSNAAAAVLGVEDAKFGVTINY